MYKGYPTNWFRQVAKSWNINYTIYSMIVGYKGYVMIHPQFPQKSQQTTWRQAKPEHLDGRPHRVARHRHAGAIFKRRWMDAEWRCWCGHTACEDMWRYVKCSEVFGSVWKDHADDHLIPFVCIKWWSECSDCSRMMLHFFPCSDVFTIDWIRCSKLSRKIYAYYIDLHCSKDLLYYSTKRANLCSTNTHESFSPHSDEEMG